MKLKIIFIVSILSFCFAFTQDYVSTIPDFQTYQSLKGKPLSDKFSNIESVKVVYDLSNKKIYFFNSTKIELHYEFVTNYLGYSMDLGLFNQRNYSNSETNRDFLLGNLNHIKGTDKWIFELAASDHMPVNLLEQFYKNVANATFIKQNLKFYLNNREKLDWFEQSKFSIPCVTSDYIFNELQYQNIVSGQTVGILKKYSLEQLKTQTPKWDEIIIVDGTPENLPICKAIIVNELQTPLSHLIILGQNRKIPIMAYTKILADAKITNLINAKVALKISTDTFSIAITNKKIIAQATKKLRKLKSNLLVKTLVDLDKINKNGVDYVGSKAQNMSYLIAISKKNNFKTPENAWAIPFYYYQNHIQKKSIATLIKALLQGSKKDSVAWINAQLKKIRIAIKEESIDIKLISQLNEKLGNQTAFKNFRFRSSTNAEDIDGFNGAGLYESKTGILNDDKKSFEKAIKQVWASVWNESSYWERDYFAIDQSTISMGILVHRAFPDELANGVVISKNLTRGDFPGITVNVQIGENSVVKPEKNVVCEQFTVYDFSQFESGKALEIDYSSQSNLNKNLPILSKVEIENLYYSIKKIQRGLGRYWSKNNYKPIDVEFKIVGEKRELYIKQVRVYND